MRQGCQRSTLVAAAFGLSLVSACGHAETPALPQAQPPVVRPVAAAPTPAPKKTSPAKKKPAGTVKPSAASKKQATGSTTTGSTPTPQPTSKPLAVTLADLKTSMEAVQSYMTHNTVIDTKKDGSTTTKNKTTTKFNAPGSLRLEVLDSTVSSKIGTRVVFTFGDTQAKVKAGGILGLATLTFPLTDGKLLSNNGWRLDQMVVKGVLERLTSADYEAKVAGSTTLAGSKLTILKVTSNGQNSLDGDIDYEYVGFDANKLVRHWAVYGKPALGLSQNLMYQLSIEKFDTNVSLPADTFKL